MEEGVGEESEGRWVWGGVGEESEGRWVWGGVGRRVRGDGCGEV